MKFGAFFSWKRDADPVAVAEFVRKAPRLLQKAPLVSFDCGASLDPPTREGIPEGAAVADWGFVVELADPSDMARWKNSAEHAEVQAALAPIVDLQTYLRW